MAARRTNAGSVTSREVPSVREYATLDRHAVTELLADLPSAYPGGDGWLQRRLDDVEAGRASCLLADHRGSLGGAAIFQGRDGGRVKLCTLYVGERARRSGLGSNLMAAFQRIAAAAECYLTVSSETTSALLGLVGPFGYAPVALERDRYGPGRDEVVVARRRAAATDDHGALLMSIRPQHAERIFSGAKTHEFRRRTVRALPPSLVLVYESYPTCAVTGSFAIYGVVRDAAAGLLRLEPNLLQRQEVDAYLRGALAPVALAIRDANACGHLHSLESMGVARAPQSYLRLGEPAVDSWRESCRALA